MGGRERESSQDQKGEGKAPRTQKGKGKGGSVVFEIQFHKATLKWTREHVLAVQPYYGNLPQDQKFGDLRKYLQSSLHSHAEDVISQGIAHYQQQVQIHQNGELSMSTDRKRCNRALKRKIEQGIISEEGATLQFRHGD